MVSGRKVKTLEGAGGSQDDLRIVALEPNELLVDSLRVLGLRLGHVPKLGQLQEELGLDEVVAHRSESPIEKLGALPMAAELRRQPRQVRARTAIGNILTHRSRVRVERDLVVMKPGLAQLADAAQVCRTRGRIGEVLQLDLQHFGELAPCALRLENRLQDRGDALPLLAVLHEPFEALLRAQVRWARLQHKLVVVDRIWDALQTRLVNVRELMGEIDRLLARRLVQITAKQLGKLRPALEAPIQALQRAPRWRMRRVELESLLVTRNRVLGLVEDLFEEEAQLQQQIELGASVGGGLDPLQVERPKIVPLLMLGVQLLQRRERDRIAGLGF